MAKSIRTVRSTRVAPYLGAVAKRVQAGGLGAGASTRGGDAASGGQYSAHFREVALVGAHAGRVEQASVRWCGEQADGKHWKEDTHGFE